MGPGFSRGAEEKEKTDIFKHRARKSGRPRSTQAISGGEPHVAREGKVVWPVNTISGASLRPSYKFGDDGLHCIRTGK